MNNLFKKNLSYFNSYFYKYNTRLILISYLCLIIIASLLFSYKFASYFPDLVNNNYIKLEKIPFNHGQIINNLLHNFSYKIQLYNNVDFYLDRMPLVSFVTIIIGRISSNIYFFLFIKNIFLFLLFFYICNKIKHIFNNNPYFLFLLTHIFFFNFYNLQTSLNFVFEDAYISILLPILFLILINVKIKNQ